MTSAAIRRFSAKLDAYPAGFAGNPLNLLLVHDAEPISDAESYLRQLDDLSLMEERREYLMDEESPWPFPRVRCDERPDPWLVSERLFENFDQAPSHLYTQQDVGVLLEERVRRTSPSVVVLVIVDGLSYYDLSDTSDAEPCLVAGVSTTQYGYRAVVGEPSISRRMFAMGYVEQIGFTYYPTDSNGLSADIHDTFSPSQVIRVREFEEVIEQIKARRMTRGYVQVTLTGLDQLSHHHTDRPLYESHLNKVMERFDALYDCLRVGGKHILACLTADHGILWRDIVEERLEIANDLFQDEIYHPRYVKGAILRPYGRTCRSLDQNFTLFKVPWMTRDFRNNEWGVHGGISAWESIVPLILRQT